MAAGELMRITFVDLFRVSETDRGHHFENALTALLRIFYSMYDKNLIEVSTYGVQIRKTTEGKEAIMQDKRFYVCHLDFDPIIEETDATVIVKGLASLS